MPFTRKTKAALLNWVNTFPLGTKVKSLAELSDGLLLAEMLKHINTQYAVENLERHKSPSLWLSKKKSLEAVYKSLLRYIRDCCEETDSLSFERAIDFNAIAENDDAEQMVKLLTILLIAAMKGTTGPKYYEKLISLDQADQLEIAEVIRLMESQAHHFDQPSWPKHMSKQPRRSQPSDTDRGLAFEEEHASLKKEHEDLKKRHADYITRFDRLEQSYYDLQEHSKEADRELQVLRVDPNSDSLRYTENLRDKLREANDLIASQERQLETDRDIKERQRKEIAASNASNKQFAELQDEVALLKNENENISKKANALDNYQKKLDRMSRIEGDNETLRRRLDVLQENQVDYDKVFQENAMLRKNTDEYKVCFANYEDDFVNLNCEKKHLETELYSCRARVHTLEENKRHDEKLVEDLQEQLKAGLPVPISPNSPTDVPLHMNLEHELEQIGSADDVLQIARLKAENNLLNNASGGSNVATLKASLEELKRKYKRLQQNHQELTEQHATLSFHLAAVTIASMDEKDEAVMKSRKLYLEAREEAQNVKKQLDDTSTKLSDRERDLTSVKADLLAVHEDDTKALEGLKAANDLITTSLETDISLFRDRCNSLLDDSEQANKHLLAALLVKNKLEGDLLAEKAGKGRQVSTEESQAQESIIQDLRTRLKAAEKANSIETQEDTATTLVNLRRENALITTAWYDLTSRLQSNHVVLQRRQEAPRSWLSRQRQTVLGGGGTW